MGDLEGFQGLQGLGFGFRRVPGSKYQYGNMFLLIGGEMSLS